MDESAFWLLPAVIRTWAPRGSRPSLVCRGRQLRLTVISAITRSPVRRRLNLHFRILRTGVSTEDIMNFVRVVARRVGRPVTFVWDGLGQHTKAARLMDGHRYRFIRLPPYAPDANPDEQVWRHAKYAILRNTVADDLDQLEANVIAALRTIACNQQLLRSFFRFARLSL